MNQLNQIIADCDAERAKQKNKLNHVMNERDILGNRIPLLLYMIRWPLHYMFYINLLRSMS